MQTFYHRFCECAERWPQNIALEIQRKEHIESYTYAEVRHMADSVGRWVVQSEFPPGARIAILADNHPRWVAAYLGIIAARCTTVPLDTALHKNQIAKLLKDSGSSVLLCDAKHLQLAHIPVTELGIQLVLTDSATSGKDAESSSITATTLDQIFAAGPDTFIAKKVSADDLVSLLYTSGTTADPKGVMLTHANLMGEVEAVMGWAHLGPSDALLGVLPLFHVLSQMANILLPLVHGSRVVYLETLNTTELLRALRERQITAFAVVPQFFYLIHEKIFKEIGKRGKLASFAVHAMMSVTRIARRTGWNTGKIFFRQIHNTFGDKMRYLVTGGSRFDPQIGRDFYALGIDILQAYGLTETTAAVFATSPIDNVIGSVGKPLTGVEARIIDAETQESGSPAVGEIAVRGAVVMKGYWNRPEATGEVLKDGWFHTGDLGYFDHDGNLFITGRKKEVIILSNGKNIYPEEVEAHYLKSAYIKEICVMGLESQPGDPMSERLYAVLVPNFEVMRERKVVNTREVIRFDIESLSAQLPSTKRIGGYEIWQEDLPRTTTRKLKRFEIEKRVRAGQGKSQSSDEPLTAQVLSAEDSGWLEQPNVKRAIDIIRSSTKRPEVRPGDNLELDLGLDSMQRVELLVALEQQLGGDLEESRLSEIYTVRQLVDAILQSAGSGNAGTLRPHVAGWNSVFEEQPTESEVLALANPRSLDKFFLFVLMRIIKVLSLVFFRLQVRGLDKLPADGPFIISSNHQSYLDPIIMSSVFRWRMFKEMFAVGTSEIFGSGPMRLLARWLRVVVVDPDANLIPAMRAGAFGLRSGRILVLYPEGERSIDGSPKIFKKGVAILSTHLQVPIVPVAIEGFHDAWPRGKSFQKFARLKIKFGEPIYPPAAPEASEAVYEELTADLKGRVVAMWEELQKEN
ncbi:MAG TPA: AMP-binding protein [Terriglobales bacterium]|nr:AMP-binding protein [Terriglobales bacterium]